MYTTLTYCHTSTSPDGPCDTTVAHIWVQVNALQVTSFESYSESKINKE